MSRALFHTWRNIHENAPVCFCQKMSRTNVPYLIPSPLNVKLTLSGGKLNISICRRPLTAALVCLVWRLVLFNNKRPYTSFVLHGIPESYRPIPSSKTLTFKMRRSGQPFSWKWVLFAREWKIIFISKAEHLTSFWHRGSGGNSEMAYWLTGASLRFNEPLSGYLRTSFSSRVSIKSSVFQRNRRISRIVLRGNTTERARVTTTTTKETTK